MRNRRTRNHILHDVGVIGTSVLVALWMQNSGFINAAVNSTSGYHWFESFVAGLFFTSAFTTAPAIVALGNIAQAGSLLQTVLFGGLGATLGDLIIFHLFRDALAEDFFVLAGKKEEGRIIHIFRLRIFRWFTPFIAALIMASPLPDELAMMLMGFSRTNERLVIGFSFVANTLGIVVIGLAARALQ